MLLHVLRAGIARLRSRFTGSNDREFDTELDQHLTLLTERYVRHGMTPDDAARAARRQFGNMTVLLEERRRLQTVPWIESLWRDCRHAVRVLRTERTFAATIVVTLALGIGANTAIFSLCNAVLLKPLPYVEADRIVMLWEQMPNGVLIPVSPANFVDWRQQTRSFSDVAAINPFPSFVLTGSGDPTRLTAAAVSSNFFTVVGTRMAHGRDFLPAEDQPSQNRVVVLDHATWVDRFGGRADILGSSVSLSDASYTVIGVLPHDFQFVGKTSDYQARTRFDVWVPLALNATPSRGSHPLRIFARLRPETDIDAAQAELDVLGVSLARAYPEENKGKGIRAVPLRQQATSDVRRGLLTLLAAVAFVLAVACANVANLLLTRGVSRQREIALRLAIGASRARIAQQLLVESTLLAIVGGLAGVILALTTVRLAVPYLPADLSRAAGLSVDWRVLVFTAGITVLTGLLFGLAPVFHVRRARASEALASGTRVAGGAHGRLRSGLVIAQLAVAVVLLIGAALMARSLWTLLQAPLGFRSEQLFTARVTLPRLRYQDAAAVAIFQRSLLDRLRNTPGVVSAAAAAYLPLSGDDNGWAFFVEGRPPGPVGVYQVAHYRPVTDGYFETLGMPVAEGRSFTGADDSPDAPFVVVINQAMARIYFAGENPVGQRLRFGGPVWRTIVGVVADVRHESLATDAKPEMYIPLAQARDPESAPTIVVRTAIDAAAMTPTLRAAVAAVDPLVPLDRVRTMAQLVSTSVGEPRFRTFLLVALSMLALLMAAVGIYGVVSYTIAQRTREFGICMAIGATPRTVVRLVLRRAVELIIAGLAVGLLASFALTRLIARLLYGVLPLDPLAFAVVSLLMVTVTFVASYIPARRATRIDPIAALRYE